MDWKKLMSATRRKDMHDDKGQSLNAGGDRTEFERDYDRVLFSTPVRRLADKTQVFPLEKNDSVRTRLTHSHEVSNIARSIGVALAHREGTKFNSAEYQRDLPSILATVGLAHDIGNPPFGHQGEYAIGDWFKKNQGTVFEFLECENLNFSSDEKKRMRLDFEKFEGNAQALRVLTKLQIMNDNFGLNLTCGALAALMKYPGTSEQQDRSNIATKKFGCFHSELDVLADIQKETGLKAGLRHPLTFLMEASDDIAYSVLDVEDAVKKGLISYRDLISYLEAGADGKPETDTVIKDVCTRADEQHKKHKDSKLSPNEVNDLSTQMFRVFAIGSMVSAVIEAFLERQSDIETGALKDDLISVSSAALLCEKLKTFALENAYKHRSVLELELEGHKVIHSIMDMLWPAIVSRGDPQEATKGHPGTPFEKYAYGRISENYRRVFESPNEALPLGYRRCQLLADMISGMTDGFALSFERELRELRC
ncbi:dGTP triphosphohydrolase [Paracoccus seriniphilus]|uniref:dGTPase n=1 Tax=Paracoccus seriniphilus TaxID=184748 RepID=A0A239PWD0_9RHOB|nr:dNTP triphosphohydrolase [Paracoccus seriniphilus]WCR13198.1 dNTP triphosphohydrolase [Paracoccus seriniphilus]SNT74470.1 dGTPase [Paracoccus seriniphilus]